MIRSIPHRAAPPARFRLALLLFAGAPALACTDAHGDFDFWLGTWEVRAADGRLAGHNRIEKMAGGCRIDETWQGAKGSTGRSINFPDPVDGRWEQVWHSPGGMFIRIRGGLEDDGSMGLEGIIHYPEQDRTAPFRGRWTPLADGRVRQFFQEYSEGEDTWKPWFEGFYSRIDPDDMP
jgi:hypothetical protein